MRQLIDRDAWQQLFRRHDHFRFRVEQTVVDRLFHERLKEWTDNRPSFDGTEQNKIKFWLTWHKDKDAVAFLHTNRLQNITRTITFFLHIRIRVPLFSIPIEIKQCHFCRQFTFRMAVDGFICQIDFPRQIPRKQCFCLCPLKRLTSLFIRR